MINLHVSAPATGISMGFFYGAGLAFGVPALLLILSDMIGVITGRIDVTTAEFVKDSEDELSLEHQPVPPLAAPSIKQ